MKITPVKKERKLDGEESGEDFVGRGPTGDYLLGELNRARGRMIPEQIWSPALRDFAVRWNRYKDSRRVLDFCDLIETASRELPTVPGNPQVIFADEAQDLNPMQLNLVRKWGQNARYFVIAIDDDQTIYSWCSATPEAVLDPDIPENHKIFLKQSYRVPRAVHARADRLIRQVSRREKKVYEPRAEDGVCLELSQGGYKSPEYWILKAIMKHLEQGQKVMVLASCSYMLHPIIAVLKKYGVPFHNPYRKSAGFWNPLRLGRKESSVNRILSLLRPGAFNYRDLKLWTEWLGKNKLRPGARDIIKASDDSLQVTPERLAELFEPDAIRALLGDSRQRLDWWYRSISPSFHGRVEFSIKVARDGGGNALADPPGVITGTIHSVKGGQADVVFLFPDLSPAGYAAYQQHGPERDSILRLFYVGMTRARHTLYICQRESSMAAVI